MAVYKRKGASTWEVKVRHPYTRQQVTRLVDHRTGEHFYRKEDAIKYEAWLILELSASTMGAVPGMTLKEHGRDWWRDHIIPKTKPKTQDGYKALWKNQILPHLGEYPLDAITTPMIEKWQGILIKSGTTTVTANRAFDVLSGCLSAAARWGRIPANPCTPIKRLKETRTQRRYMTTEQVYKLADSCPGLRDRTMILLGAFTGLRISELVGLSWTDIRSDRIEVRHQLDEKTLTLVDCKDYERGHVDVPEWLSVIIDDWRNACPYSTIDGLVFRNRNGEPIRVDTWRKSIMNAACARAGYVDTIGEITRAWFKPHDLRHFFASWVREIDLPMEYLAARMRHSSPAYTMKQYGELWRGARAPEAIAKMDAWRAERSG